MLRGRLPPVLTAFAIALALGVLIPLHLAAEHHGHVAESHEADEHGHHHEREHPAGDHTALAAAKPAPAPILDLRPATPVAPTVLAFPDPAGFLAGRRVERLHDPPDPDRAAAPPVPPRAPPILRA